MAFSISKYISGRGINSNIVPFTLQPSEAILSDAKSMPTVIPFVLSKQCLDQNHSAFE